MNVVVTTSLQDLKEKKTLANKPLFVRETLHQKKDIKGENE